MNIKNLLTPEQYKEQLKEYSKIFPNKEITFFEFCTNTYKLKPNKGGEIPQFFKLKNKQNVRNEN